MKPLFRIIALLAFTLIGVGSMPGEAHHSLSAEFNVQKQVVLTGTVTKVEWTNPHTWLRLDVKESAGSKVADWAFEMPSPNMFVRLGWMPSDFHLGMQVTVSAYPSRDGSRKACALVVTSSDGRKLFAGPAAATP